MEINSGNNPNLIEKQAENIKPEVKGHVGKYEILEYPNARENANRFKNELLDRWGQYSTYPREELEHKMKKNPYGLNPAFLYYDNLYVGATRGQKKKIVGAAADFNDTYSSRQGFNKKHTFTRDLENTQRELINMAGSSIIVTALAKSQIVDYHLRKEDTRALETGEKSLAADIITSFENGRGWNIPRLENGQVMGTEYRLPLSEKQQYALDHLREKVKDVAKAFRSEGMVAFVNDQKFSKITMECSKNGREWYMETIEKVLLPHLKENGADWDGNPGRFSLDGVQFAVSPTGETWEIEIVEGADKIGKRLAWDVINYSISDILAKEKAPNVPVATITLGDSVKYNGSDYGLTLPNNATVPFVVANSDRPVSQSMNTLLDMEATGRKYHPIYLPDENGNYVLKGTADQSAYCIQTVLKTMPFIYIPTADMGNSIIERITNVYSFKKYGEKPIQSGTSKLYDFPEEITEGQRKVFLNGISDLPVPVDDLGQHNLLINRINQTLAKK